MLLEDVHDLKGKFPCIKGSGLVYVSALTKRSLVLVALLCVKVGGFWKKLFNDLSDDRMCQCLFTVHLMMWLNES